MGLGVHFLSGDVVQPSGQRQQDWLLEQLLFKGCCSLQDGVNNTGVTQRRRLSKDNAPRNDLKTA